MIITGIIILCFIVFHICDLTLGVRPMATSEFMEGSAYTNLVYSFERPAVAFFYCLTMFLLAFHISHGVWSVVNDFGGTGSRLRKVIFIVAGLVAIVAALGNFMIPVAVQLHILTI
jgi:succinate dehydrogenase / fumarate reductase cytochrome b subunit